MREALTPTCGAREKIHDRCCQGFRASSASQCTVDAEGRERGRWLPHGGPARGRSSGPAASRPRRASRTREPWPRPRRGRGTRGRRDRVVQARHTRRVRQAQHEAAKTLIGWAVENRIGTLAAGDPRGVLDLAAGRRHNQRTRAWRIGHLIRALSDKAEAAGITVRLIDERGTSSTCPACARRVPKPAGRVFTCPHCGHCGHRDLVAAANIAARAGGGTIRAPSGARITHRRAGAHLPGVHPARRDPRRRRPSRPTSGPLAGPARPARHALPPGESLAAKRGARKPAR